MILSWYFHGTNRQIHRSHISSPTHIPGKHRQMARCRFSRLLVRGGDDGGCLQVRTGAPKYGRCCIRGKVHQQRLNTLTCSPIWTSRRCQPSSRSFCKACFTSQYPVPIGLHPYSFPSRIYNCFDILSFLPYRSEPECM